MGELNLLRAASQALRSYQYGNGSPELAESIADKIDAALAATPAADGAVVEALLRRAMESLSELIDTLDMATVCDTIPPGAPANGPRGKAATIHNEIAWLLQSRPTPSGDDHG